jgi:hypothetical protein
MNHDALGFDVPPPSEIAGDAARLSGPLTSSSTKSLNFLLPWDALDGAATLQVHVFTADGGPGTSATGVTQVHFHPRRRFRVIYVPIADTLRNIPPVPVAEFTTVWRRAVAKLPLSEHHWLEHWQMAPFATDEDLADADGWSSLLDDLVDLYDDMDLDESWDIMIGLVSNSPAYLPAGLSGKARRGSGVNVAIAMPDASTVAHEVTHAFSFKHNACGLANEIDPTLPCTVGDVGADLGDNSVVAPYASDLMSTPGGVLPSAVLWQRLFDGIPVP